MFYLQRQINLPLRTINLLFTPSHTPAIQGTLVQRPKAIHSHPPIWSHFQDDHTSQRSVEDQNLHPTSVCRSSTQLMRSSISTRFAAEKKKKARREKLSPRLISGSSESESSSSSRGTFSGEMHRRRFPGGKAGSSPNYRTKLLRKKERLRRHKLIELPSKRERGIRLFFLEPV